MQHKVTQTLRSCLSILFECNLPLFILVIFPSNPHRDLILLLSDERKVVYKVMITRLQKSFRVSTTKS